MILILIGCAREPHQSQDTFECCIKQPPRLVHKSDNFVELLRIKYGSAG